MYYHSPQVLLASLQSSTLSIPHCWHGCRKMCDTFRSGCTLQISSSLRSVATNSFLEGRSTPYTLGKRTGGEALAKYTCITHTHSINLLPHKPNWSTLMHNGWSWCRQATCAYTVGAAIAMHLSCRGWCSQRRWAAPVFDATSSFHFFQTCVSCPWHQGPETACCRRNSGLKWKHSGPLWTKCIDAMLPEQ